MKKHVLFIVENQSVPYDVRVWAEALTVKGLGYDVSIICPMNKRGPKRYEEIEGIEIFRHPEPLEANAKWAFLFEYLNAIFWELILSFRIFFKKPFQVIHSANPPDHVFLIAWIFKIFGTKYIFDHHDISPENYVAKFEKKDIFYKILLIMEKLTFKTADLVISTNESYKKVAISRGGKNKNEVFVVRNGPNLSKVIFMEPNERLKEGFEFLVAYIGVIGTQEGIDILLNSVNYIVNNKQITNIKFVIIGTGPNWASMVQMSEKLRLGKFVTFTGFIPYRDVYEILATADICVNPELRNDFTDKSTMLKIMDYMTFGKPIVQFLTTEGKVTAENAALYITENNYIIFADAIVDLLYDPDKRIKMGGIGRKRIDEELNWDHQKIYLKKAYDYLENMSRR